MNDCAFYLKKRCGFMPDASNRGPDKAFTPHPAQSALPTQFIFVSA